LAWTSGDTGRSGRRCSSVCGGERGRSKRDRFPDFSQRESSAFADRVQAVDRRSEQMTSSSRTTGGVVRCGRVGGQRAGQRSVWPGSAAGVAVLRCSTVYRPWIRGAKAPAAASCTASLALNGRALPATHCRFTRVGGVAAVGLARTSSLHRHVEQRADVVRRRLATLGARPCGATGCGVARDGTGGLRPAASRAEAVAIPRRIRASPTPPSRAAGPTAIGIPAAPPLAGLRHRVCA
jgi:hypothetical protein